MSLSMYQASVPVFAQMLGALGNVLGKAEAHAAAKKIDPAVLMAPGWRPTCSPSPASCISPATSPRARRRVWPASRCQAGPTTRRHSPSSRSA